MNTKIVEPLYLRVKNWGSFQHYRDRNPPWIKLHNSLLTDTGFLEMTEPHQWQLVRTWMLASRCDTRGLDNNGDVVPAIGGDEKWIRRAIGSLAKVPVAAFVRDGWLIPVDLLDASTHASAHASAGASTDASTDASAHASALLGLEKYQIKELRALPLARPDGAAPEADPTALSYELKGVMP